MHRLLIFLPLLLACNEAGLRVSNKAPEAQIVDPADGGEVAEGYEVTLVGAATDDDNASADLEAKWLVDGDERCGWAEASEDGTTTCTVVFAGDSDGEVVLQVRDPSGASASDRITLVVTPTDAPTARITSPSSDGVFYSDQLVTLSGEVADTEDAADALTVAWTSTVPEADLSGVNTSPSSDGAVSGTALLPQGEHELRLTVTDTTDKVGFDTLNINVGPPNSAPECALVSPEDLTGGEEGALLVMSGSATDVDVPSDLLDVTFESNLDGVLDTLRPTSDGTVSLPWSDLTVGTHTLTMTVTDEVGATCTDATIYTVGTPPSVRILAPDDDAVGRLGLESRARAGRSRWVLDLPIPSPMFRR